MAYAPALGAGGETLGGSSPPLPTFSWILDDARDSPYQHTEQASQGSGLLPQLLNAIDEAEVARLVSDPRWAMQEKKDVRRLLLRKEDGGVTGINKLGLTVGVPETTLSARPAI